MLGRIKTSFIKHLTEKILAEHRDKFTTDFEKNKKVLEEIIDIKSKKIRNQVVGYITKLMEKSG